MLRPYIPEGKTVLMQWHGGEPTLMGPDYIRYGIQELSKSNEYIWKHGIQTNLMNYSNQWGDLYHEYFQSEIGVSWDPTIRLLNARAKDSHPLVKAKFEQNLQKAIDDGLTPYVVVTAAQTLFDAYKNPFDFFQYWIEKGVSHVHLERITQTGYARDNWAKVGLSNNSYSTQMARWAKAYHLFKKNHVGTNFFLSPFESLSESVQSLLNNEPQASGCWSGKCDTRFHTIDGQGYKGGCTALTSETGNKNATPPKLTNSSYKDKRELRIFNCNECKYKSICKTGCLALDFDDGSGECSGGKKLFETLTQIIKD
jgi:radical SAM protein with 4Fe4S-binding SPASM domain